MRPSFIAGVVSHVVQNKIKYILLSFVFLTGCMAGYYTLDGISGSLAQTVKSNLGARFSGDGSDAVTILLAVFFAGVVWLCGFSPAGLALTPLLLLVGAGAQVFLFRVAVMDADVGGGFLAVLCVPLLFLWACFALGLCETAVENAHGLLASRELRLSFGEKAVLANRKAKNYCITAFLYVICSYCVFLMERAIF